VPAEIGQLTSLEHLDLRSNRLTSLPAEIGQLTSLEELSLSGNQLTSVPAEGFALTAFASAYTTSTVQDLQAPRLADLQTWENPKPSHSQILCPTLKPRSTLETIHLNHTRDQKKNQTRPQWRLHPWKTKDHHIIPRNI